MNLDETRAFSYLKTNFGEDVIFEPDGQVPPDFLVNSTIAIEVRRLNQNFFEGENSEGLEQITIPMFQILKDVSASFDSKYKGKTYWVSVRFKRPLNSDMKQIRRDMKNAFENFLDSGELIIPCKLSVSKSIEFTIYPSQPIDGRIFRPAGGVDRNAGGWVIPVYKENLQLCVIEKSSKVAQFLPKYHEWWLCLVDNMGWGLDVEETNDLIDSITDLGNFDRVIILSNDGQRLLASTQYVQ